MRTAASGNLLQRFAGSVLGALPEGGSLHPASWDQRHRVILWLLWLHALGIAFYGMLRGNDPAHSILEACAIVPFALVGARGSAALRVRSSAASLGLLTASALLVHLADGAIEAHFHFFVMLSVIALYQDWFPFLLALCFVVLEHGVLGWLVPAAVYNHPDAVANPWKWATIHAVFVLGSSAANVAHWRLSELTQRERRRSQERLRESQRTLATLMSNLPGMAYRCANNPNWPMEFVSEGGLSLTGYTREDLMGERVLYGDLIHSNDRDRLWVETQHALAERRPFEHVYRIVDASGAERWVWEQGRGVYAEDGSVLALEGFITDITARHQAEQALAHQARHDPLTELPNRTLLLHELQRALHDASRNASPLALLMMDLDRFKEVNDTFGHGCGDLLLQDAGRRLQATLGGSGILARLGGDEFGVLLTGDSAENAQLVAQRLLSALEEPFPLEGQHLVLGASIGIAAYPDHGTDVETLQRHADVAMYVAKRSGSGSAIYAPEQDQHTADRLALTGELKQAIERRQLVLHYQPLVDCKRRQVTSVEALVRWEHPVHGLIPPDRFIPLAEQSGLIKAVTNFVLEEALRQCRVWQNEGIDMSVSVNLSMRNLHDPQLPGTIAQLLQLEGVAADRLNLEITESMIMADPARALDVLRQLRALGLTIAIDDFGTGYSSLAHLKGLAVDELKIDKSFVRNLASDSSDRAIVRSAVELGHNLGLRVIAEGVEDVESLNQLTRLGCDMAQGYYLSRPQTAAALDGWLRESSWAPGDLPRAA